MARKTQRAGNAAVLVTGLVLGYVATAGAEPLATRFDSGVGLAVGAFGVKGRFAAQSHGEGGALLRVPLFLRLRSLEVEAAPFFASGAIDAADPSWGYQGWAFSAKKFVSLYGKKDRETSLYLESYLRGGFERVTFERQDTHHLGLSVGAGVAVRLQAGRSVRASYRFFAELSRCYYGEGEWALAASRLQSISVGLTFLGVGG